MKDVIGTKRENMSHSRPSWNDYFIGLAHYVSTRSHDSQTQVGCVIVNGQHAVVGVGYNGFPGGVDDSSLPTTRPGKYPFIAHAEANAVSNLIVKHMDWYTAYITHLPCSTCAKLLWQNGVHEWYVPKGAKAHSQTEEDHIVYEFLSKNGLEINLIEPNLSHLNQLASSLESS